MNSISGFSARRFEKNPVTGSISLLSPHRYLFIQGFPTRAWRARPEDEEKQGMSHSIYYTSQSLQGEDFFGNQSSGEAQSRGNFCSVSRYQWCRGQLQAWQLLLLWHAQGKSCNGDPQLWGICPLPILHYWCKSTQRFRLLCSLSYAFS